MVMFYWFESMSRPPEIDQPNVRRLGVFKSAAMITFNQQHYYFSTRFLSLDVNWGLEYRYCCLPNPFWFYILPPSFSLWSPRKGMVHHLNSDGSTDVNKSSCGDTCTGIRRSHFTKWQPLWGKHYVKWRPTESIKGVSALLTSIRLHGSSGQYVPFC